MVKEIEQLLARLSELGDRLDLPRKREELNQLRERLNQPNFWMTEGDAQAVVRKVSELQSELEPWDGIERKARELMAFAQLAVEEDDESINEELEAELVSIKGEFEELEMRALLSGEHDGKNAILSINPGAGGVDAMDWAEMLARMYRMWAQRRGYEFRVIEILPGEQAGIKSLTALVKGPYAYGYLKAERGVHRLVRISPFDFNRRRHTSFASVDVIPEIGEEIKVEINPEELRIETFRASGHGGQHVNTTDSAVRITHIPTGIVVTCQAERSQLRNRQIAMEVLRSRLYEYERRKRLEEIERLRGERKEISFGSQIRSYVLHPYTLVKDHRTGVERTNVEAVLDGEIDEFISAYLRAYGGGDDGQR
ncbi:MAG: peptide chain release factor 2 [Armatimonadota bacterium]|nr:peptide chain release factor 2 [Armatimonadota bacterium]MCX7777649.1 peptide chain release factor 2 [Armatimonadota bacterium]MDW8025895.1 peptide chain release factor 2 [Armatimonadota bacterium]